MKFQSRIQLNTNLHVVRKSKLEFQSEKFTIHIISNGTGSYLVCTGNPSHQTYRDCKSLVEASCVHDAIVLRKMKEGFKLLSTSDSGEFPPLIIPDEPTEQQPVTRLVHKSLETRKLGL